MSLSLAPDSLANLQKIQKILLEKKCESLAFLDLSEVHDYLSFFVIATVRTETQARSVARELEKSLKLQRDLRRKTEPKSDGDCWILLDSGEICIHLMTEKTRTYYALERLWGDASSLSLPSP